MSKCYMDNCEEVVWSKGLCNKHRQRESRGTLYKKTWADKNDILKEGKFTFLVTYNREGTISSKSYIDEDDITRVLTRKWYFRKGDGYVASSSTDKSIFLHHFIIGNSDIVDHINRDRLDNRKENLRNVTFQQNILNSSLRKDNTSGTKGVRYDKRRLSPWYCSIHVNGKTIFGGYFKSKEEAVIKRKELENEYHLPIWNQL